jgi:hypothetical protein
VVVKYSGIPGFLPKRGGFEMDITGIAKSRHADIPKASSKKEWKISIVHFAAP